MQGKVAQVATATAHVHFVTFQAGVIGQLIPRHVVVAGFKERKTLLLQRPLFDTAH